LNCVTAVPWLCVQLASAVDRALRVSQVLDNPDMRAATRWVIWLVALACASDSRAALEIPPGLPGIDHRVEASLERDFDAARGIRDFERADGLAVKLLALTRGGQLAKVAEYYVHDRKRCADALVLLDTVRRHYPTTYESSDSRLVDEALVCRAAELLPQDPESAKALLGEAIDHQLRPENYHHNVDFYDRFAEQALLNMDVLKMLIEFGIDDRSNGGALIEQIRAGRIDNVRTLLSMGADPNRASSWRWLLPLQQARISLREHGAVEIEIAKELLAHGANPNLIVTYELKPEGEELAGAVSPLQPAFDELLRAAGESLPKVTVDFEDQEPNLETARPDYFRFRVRNAGNTAVDLHLRKDSEGFVFLSEGALIEERLPPGTEWHATEAIEPCDEQCGKPIRLGARKAVLIRVPVNLLGFDEAPPPTLLRLKIDWPEGAIVSPPFALHTDGHVVQ
jgi:hypothetical protein